MTCDRVRRVSPVPNRGLINPDYASSGSAQMVQHRAPRLVRINRRTMAPIFARAGLFTEQSVCTLRHSARGTKSRTCLHIDLWTRSAIYFQALDKQ
jgi:hypothetical protein